MSLRVLISPGLIPASDNLILIKAQVDNEEPIFKNDLYYNDLKIQEIP